MFEFADKIGNIIFASNGRIVIRQCLLLQFFLWCYGDGIYPVIHLSICFLGSVLHI